MAQESPAIAPGFFYGESKLRIGAMGSRGGFGSAGVLGTVSKTKTAMQLKAQAILAQIATAPARADYGGTATWTVGGNYGNSSVQAGSAWNTPQFTLDNATKFRIMGAPTVVDANKTTKDRSTQWGSPDGPLSDGGSGWGVGFNYDKRTFDIGLQGDAGLIMCRVRINGQWIATISRPSGGFAYHKLDMGSAASRTIELFFSGNGGTLGGVNFETGATVTPLATPAFTMMAIGDSIETGGTYGTQYTDLMLSTPPMIAEALGQPFLEVRAITGQGYVTTVDSETIGSRAAADAIRKSPVPDVIFMKGSANDSSVNSDAALKTAVQAVLAAAPNAFVIAASCFRQPGIDLGSTKAAANLAALQSIGNPRLCVIDSFNWIVPGGNSATYIDGTTNHPNAAGASYLAYSCWKPAVVSFLTAYAA